MPTRLPRRSFLRSGILAGGLPLVPPAWAWRNADIPQRRSTGLVDDREQWLEYLERVSEAPLKALSQRTLRQSMPVEAMQGYGAERAIGSPLEALGRLLAGLAPWLELEASAQESPRESALRNRYRTYARQAIASAVDAASADYMRFGQSAQTLVDSSFLALALLRAPKQLMASMEPATRTRLVAALESERNIQPPFNNWLLFAALNEVLLRQLGVSWDKLRIDYALRELQAWYMGDGFYGDGAQFHADFYNSYVMHPYLLAIMDGVRDVDSWKGMRASILERAHRYAEVQERMISPTGTFPVLGRSITYRAGAFHLLADIALRSELPKTLAPAAVRGALTAVLCATLDPPGTFTPDGWLQIGLAGHQPSLGETYISTGSLYLCSAAWLPFGLPPSDPFWAVKAVPWTQKAVWAGQDARADHAL